MLRLEPVWGFEVPHPPKHLLSLTIGSHLNKTFQGPPYTITFRENSCSLRNAFKALYNLPLPSASNVAESTHIPQACCAVISPKVPCLGLPLFQPWAYLLLTHRLLYKSRAWPIWSPLCGSWDWDRKRLAQLAEGCGPLKSYQLESWVYHLGETQLGRKCRPWQKKQSTWKI